MKIGGHKPRSVIDRYNITSEDDLKEAATRLKNYIQTKKVTLLVAPESSMSQKGISSKGEILESLEEMMELARGIEPPTGGLQNRCSTD